MKITLITPAHNEERVIEGCILSIKGLKVPEGFTLEHVVVLDRCTDRTGEICRFHGVRTIVKRERGPCVSPITETVKYGFERTDGEIVGKVDADVRAPPDALLKLLPALGGKVACVAADVRTRTGKWWLDLLFRLRDLNYWITPFGREPRGAFRLFRREVIERIGGFDCDKPTFDTALDLKLRMNGYESRLVRDVVVWEYRPDLTVGSIVRHQIEAGRARRKLGVGFWRTLLHSVFRGRPFVLLGYALEALSGSSGRSFDSNQPHGSQA